MKQAISSIKNSLKSFFSDILPTCSGQITFKDNLIQIRNNKFQEAGFKDFDIFNYFVYKDTIILNRKEAQTSKAQEQH